MGSLYVARDPNRGAVMLPLGGTEKNPNVIIPLYKKLERSYLNELIISACQKQGLTQKESEILSDAAEEQYEYRLRVKEASKELHMRIDEKARYPKLKHGGIKPHRIKSQDTNEAFH